VDSSVALFLYAARDKFVGCTTVRIHVGALFENILIRNPTSAFRTVLVLSCFNSAPQKVMSGLLRKRTSELARITFDDCRPSSVVVAHHRTAQRIDAASCVRPRPTLEPYHTASAVVHHSKFRWLMSALGHKRTSRPIRSMSALPPKADFHSEMNHATMGCMGDGICTPDRIELVDESTNMELGGMDR